MKKVVNLITKKTMAIAPAYDLEHESIIYEVDRTFFSKKRPLEILDDACICRCSTYEGRIRAVRRKLGHYKKTPLMISPDEMLYAFPTKSPERYDCIWVFPRHVKDWREAGENALMVRFFNGLEITVNCSSYTFKRQKEKTADCLMHFSDPPFVHIKAFSAVKKETEKI